MVKTELTHSGIKGMRWGIRRFQNKDGTLTPEGKKRYANDVEGRDDAHDDHKKARAKSAASMSDKELQEAISRLQREKLYSDLTKPKASKGREYADKAIGKIGDKVIEVGVNKLGEKILSKIFDTAFDMASGKAKAEIGKTGSGRKFLRKWGYLGKKK